MREDIIRLCKEIKVRSKCSGCGGENDNYICRYCSKIDEELEKLILELKNLMSCFNSYDFNILTFLYTIKDMNIDCVNEILNRYGFESELNERYNDICVRIKNDSCGNFDYHLLIYFLDNNIFVGNNKNYFINFLMKQLLTFELEELDIEDIFSLIKMFTIMFIESKVSQPKCIYDKLDENVAGSAFWNVIALDEDEIRNMIEAGDFEGILQLVFYECTHTTQTYMINNKRIDFNRLFQVKERILRQIIQGYYTQNYGDYNADVEARYMGSFCTIEYLNSIGVDIINEKYFRDIIEVESLNIFNDKRVVNGEVLTVDEAFLKYVDDVKFLDLFPILKLQYKNFDGKIVSKSREELLFDYDMYKNGEISLNGEINEIDFLYNYLINMTKTLTNNL